MRRLLAFSLPLVAIAPSAMATPGEGEMAERLRNDPRVEALRPYGQRIPPRIRKDDGVQFGKALRFQLTGNPVFGRIGLVSPLLKPVKKGDTIVIAFWARADRTEGDVPGRIGRVQLETTPNVRAVFEQAFEVGKEWKLYQMSGIVDADYQPMELNAALHLDVQEQVLDIGPVYVFNYGQKTNG